MRAGAKEGDPQPYEGVGRCRENPFWHQLIVKSALPFAGNLDEALQAGSYVVVCEDEPSLN